LEVRHDAGILVDHLLATPSRTARACRWSDGDLIQLPQPQLHRGPGDPRGPAHRSDASSAKLTGLGGHDQPALALVQVRPKRVELAGEGLFRGHSRIIRAKS